MLGCCFFARYTKSRWKRTRKVIHNFFSLVIYGIFFVNILLNFSTHLFSKLMLPGVSWHGATRPSCHRAPLTPTENLESPVDLTEAGEPRENPHGQNMYTPHGKVPGPDSNLYRTVTLHAVVASDSEVKGWTPIFGNLVLLTPSAKLFVT